ncbi:hypothetical protein CASFOL_000993 [Castilleja foliolosa]|uniref:Cytochrome P450 n=1 Tax=Castilleja foliolosa TaxID=1961234 RepID=A0ABD3EN78_9LAMI
MLHEKRCCLCKPVSTSAITTRIFCGPRTGTTGATYIRRIASIEVLSTHRIQTTFAASRRNEVHLLVKRLLREGTSEDEYRVNEMKTIFFEMMLNIMMRMIAGKRYYDDADDDDGSAGEFKEIVDETFRVSGATNIGDFLPMLR